LKKVGILGGMSPESTVEYYKELIALADEGDLGYPEIVIYSVDFDRFCRSMDAGKEEEVMALLGEGLEALAAAGADFGLMASNTPHTFFGQLEQGSSLPLLSIVEVTARAARRRGFGRVGLLGTRYTMEGDFFKEGLERFGLESVVPGEGERNYVHEKILGELVKGEFKEETRARLKDIAKGLEEREGIDVVALACTELPLILDEEYLGLPVLDTTELHVEAALERARDDYV